TAVAAGATSSGQEGGGRGAVKTRRNGEGPGTERFRRASMWPAMETSLCVVRNRPRTDDPSTGFAFFRGADRAIRALCIETRSFSAAAFALRLGKKTAVLAAKSTSAGGTRDVPLRGLAFASIGAALESPTLSMSDVRARRAAIHRLATP
ncbi:hypothetical protein B0H12DRAFT_1149174, partial [Mycena haematopus]